MKTSSALLQLKAKGSEDLYLTYNPDITFFKKRYERYSNFSLESMNILFPTAVNFGKKVEVTIPKDGDLISRIYLQTTLPYDENSSSKWVNRVGFCLLKEVELFVGGKQIDKHYSSWMHVWTELSHDSSRKFFLDNLVGPKGKNGLNDGLKVNEENTLVIPLQFYFCRHINNAFPLLSIYNQTMTLKFNFEEKINCINGNDIPSGSLKHTSVWVDYIFLDEAERIRFINNKQEQLIEVLQYKTVNILKGINNIRLPFSLAVKELIWNIKKRNNTGDKFTNFTLNATNESPGTISMLDKATLKYNTKKRFETRDYFFFNYTQPYKHHDGNPDLGINVYSFSLQPQELMSTGYDNFSNIDNINMIIYAKEEGTLNFNMLSYNILEVTDGLAQLKFI